MIDKPSRADINVCNSLDEKVAEDHFYGLDLVSAEKLFINDSLNYQWDLLWMGPNAFNYYVSAAFSYLESEESCEDVDFVDAIYKIIEIRVEREKQQLDLEKLRNIVDFVIHHYEKYDVNEDIYGDLKLKFSNIKQALF